MRRILPLVFVFCGFGAVASSPEEDFANPPLAARPQTWWHWMNGNVSREGVTADLEAMASIGLGGAHLFDAGCGIPPGPLAFDTPEWYAMLKHACQEAKRLGLELTLSNCSGWSSSGGPWITPADAMKYVYTVSSNVVADAALTVTMPKPVANDNGFYEDIATLVFPTPTDDVKIPNWKDQIFARRVPMEVARSLMNRDRTEPGPGGTVRSDDLRVLHGEKVVVAPGAWTIVRLGYACNGQRNHPASDNGVGLECDKLAAGAVARHFEAYAGRLLRELGVRPGHNDSAFRGLLVDSYETDCQNWTQGFAETFLSRKGYAIDRFLPVLAGYVVDDLPTTEKFLLDYRRVLADLFAENYGGTLRRKCDEYGLDLYLEPYGNGPFEFLQYGSRATIPMGEFWQEDYDDYPDTGRTAWGWWCINGMCAPIAHVHGLKIVASESFSSVPWNGRWKKGPYEWKGTGDKAFCDGVTRIVYHRFAHQPWQKVWPGMTMGCFGSHFERTLTWWNQGSEWIRYQSRCQALLQRGDYVADVLFDRGDDPLDDNMFFAEPLGFGWKHDTCCSEDRAKLVWKDGRVGLPGGTRYRMLVGPQEWKTDLAGVRAKLPPPDFTCAPEDMNRLSWIHRRWEDGSEAYFVAYGRREPKTIACSFRVQGKVAEFWHPDSGKICRARDVREENGRTIVPIPFDPVGSVFVVFRQKSDAPWEPTDAGTVLKTLDGPWDVVFTQRVTNDRPKVKSVAFKTLSDWTASEDPFVRYFSGTAEYRLRSEVAVGKGARIWLDLGEVKNLVTVTLNGKTFPPLWKPPFRLDVTEALDASAGVVPIDLVLHVTNYWPNRMIGDESLPADCEYKPVEGAAEPWGGQAVKEVPSWVKQGKPSPTGRATFSTWRHFRGDEKLLPSGLMGPVRLMAR